MLSLWSNLLVADRKARDRRLQLSLLKSALVTLLRNMLAALSLSQHGPSTSLFQEDATGLLRLMRSVHAFCSSHPHTSTKERNVFMKQTLDKLEALAVEQLMSLLLEVEEGRATSAHCLRTTAECSSLLQVAVAVLMTQTDTHTDGRLFEESHTYHCWSDIALHLKQSPAVDALVQYFFAKLRWRLTMRLELLSVGQCWSDSSETGPCTSRITKLLHMLDGEGTHQAHHLNWVGILSTAAVIEHRRLQRQCLDEDIIKVLSLTASSRIVVPQNTKLSRVGQQCRTLISHVPVTTTNPSLAGPTVKHAPTPSLDVIVDAYRMSLEAALAAVEKWYTAGIRQSLAKWSLKQLFTLAVHDLGEASEEIADTVARGVDVPHCSRVLQQCKGEFRLLQIEAAESCNRRLTRTCCAIWTDVFPSAKYWKGLKKPKGSGGLQTSAYIESLLEQIFLPLFEVMSIISVEEQAILLFWHTNLVCSGYKKAITGNARSYRKGAAQQLYHDFMEMREWLAEAVDILDELVKAQVTHSPALACLEQGLGAMLGREEPPTASSLPTTGELLPLTNGDGISPFCQHILSFPVISDTGCIFDCTNLNEWKQCMK